MTAAIGFLITAIAGGDLAAGQIAPDHAEQVRRAAPVEGGGGIIIERRIIIRIPVMPGVPRDGAAAPRSDRPSAAMRAAPSCLAVQLIRGAAVAPREGVIFITANDERYRASLEHGCNPVAFQSGFYVESPTRDTVCAGRDMLRARNGMVCLITAFSLARSR